jgi:hypothetical protein
LTRFGRNAIDCGYYLEKRLPLLGVRFIAVTDSYDSNESDNGFLLTLKNIISESYALDIGRKVKAVHQQNIADGRYVGRLAPYGYNKAPDDCHKLIVDEESAIVVKQMFSLASEGRSVSEIAKTLTGSNVQTPHQRNCERGYVKADSSVCYWQPSTVRSLLADRVYLGDMVQGKTRTISGKQINVDPSEWICVSGTHEPIIDRMLFERVQAKRQSVHEKAVLLNKEPFSANLLKGKVICAHFNRPLQRKRQNKDGTYWFRCNSQVKYGKSACYIVSVKESELIESILSELHGRLANMPEQHNIYNENDKSEAKKELEKTNREIINCKQFIKSLYENLVLGVITQDDFTGLKAGYEDKIASLSKQVDSLRESISSKGRKASKFNSCVNAATVATQRNELSAEIVDALIDNIIVNKEKDFDVKYQIEDVFMEAV